MKIELIAIGDELLNGRVTDTNGPFLAKFLHNRNLDLSYMSLCHDTEDDIFKAIELALSRSDVVFTTGGLGPTKDDKTKSSLAKYFQKKIIYSTQAEEITRNNYERYGKEWKKGQNCYPEIPEDFLPLDNFNGLAPGFYFHYQKDHQYKHLFMAPGVPREFELMLTKIFFPKIEEIYSLPKRESFEENFRQLAIRTFGVPEEKIFGELAPDLWNQLEQYGKVSSLPQRSGVNIIISLKPENMNRQKYEQFLGEIKSIVSKTPLKNQVWQYGDRSLPEYIVDQCIKKKLSFTFAESCTGGLSSSKITDVPGCSEVFNGSLVTYSNELKMSLLNVQEKSLRDHGAVSEQVVQEMAKGALEQSKSDMAIAWSGIAGPGGGSDEKPVGTLALGWIKKGQKPESKMIYSKGSRTYLKDRFSELGLLKLMELINDT